MPAGRATTSRTGSGPERMRTGPAAPTTDAVATQDRWAPTGPVAERRPHPGAQPRPAGHAAGSYCPVPPGPLPRLDTSSAVPMPAPGTIQLRGPTLGPWGGPWSEPDLRHALDAGGGPDLLSEQPPEAVAPPDSASVGTTEQASAEPTTDADVDAAAVDVDRDASAERAAQRPGGGPRIGIGGGVVSARRVERSPERERAVDLSGVEPRDVDPLSSPEADPVDDVAAIEAQREVASLEGELEAAGPDQGVEPAHPEAEALAVPEQPEVAAAGPEGVGPAAVPEPVGGDDVAAWQGRVQGAAAAIPRPRGAPATTYTEPIVAAGGTGAQALDQRAAEVPLAAKKVMEAKPLKPLPEAPNLPAPDPVPKASQRLRELAVRSLYDQRLPKLVATPHGFLPTVGGPPVDTKVPPTPPPAPKVKPGRRSATPGKAVNEALEKGPPAPVPGEGQVVTGSERAPTPTIAAPHRGDIGKVLARVYLQAPVLASEVLKDARATAYGVDLNGSDTLKDLGREREDEETGWFRAELGRVADAASIGRAALDTAIAERAKELEGGNAEKAAEVVRTAQDQERRAKESASRVQAMAQATYDSWERHLDQLSARATGGVDPTAVRAEQARITDELSTFTATHTSAWSSMRRIRERDLVRAGEDQLKAYTDAALADQAQQAEAAEKARQAAAGAPAGKAPTKEVKPPVTEVTDPVLAQWVKDRHGEVSKAVQALVTDIRTTVERWTTDLTRARDDGIEAARSWADARIGRERGWFDSLVGEWLKGLAVKRADNAAMQQAQTDETVAALGGTLQVINDLKLGGMERVDRDGRELLASLTAEEQALVQAFFAEGSAKGDTVLLLASLLGIRLKRQRRAGAQQHIRDKVLALDNVAHVRDLNRIGVSQNANFNAQRISDQLWQAFEHTWGTDEEKAFAAVKGGLTKEQSKAVRGVYKADHNEDLDARMASELSGTDYQRVKYGFDEQQAEADAAALAEAMGHVFSNDQTLITSTLRNKTAAERTAIAAAYKRLYGKELVVDFAWNLRGDDRAQVDALWAGNVEKADAIEIKMAREGFWGPDHEKIEKVYTRVRDEATAAGDAKGWKTERINAEIAKRSAKMAEEYQGVTKRGLLDDLHKSFTPDTSGMWDPSQRANVEQYWAGRRDLVMGMATGDLTRADAGKIQIERTGFYAKDETINKVLALQYSRAYDNARRDLMVDFRAKNNGRGPNAEELRALEAQAEAAAKTEGKASMGRLGSYFETHYTGGTQTFRETIEDLTQGVDEEKGLALVDQGGFLHDWQVLEYATKGAGTDEAEFERVLKKQKTKADQERLQTLWQQKTGTTRTIAELIDDETSGRLRNDLLLDNEYGGEPTDPKVMVAKATAQLDFERRSGGEQTYTDSLGQRRTVKNHEYLVLERRLAELKDLAAQKDQVKDLPESDPRRQWVDGQFDQGVQGFASGVETHRFLVDQRTELAAQIVSMAVTIAVAVLITVATGGVGSVAGAALIAGVSSLFGAAAGIATKMSMKGAAYGADELGVDIALGVVDVVVSAATAGFGGKLIKGATAAAKVAGTGGRGVVVALGRMAEGTALKRAAAHAIAEGAEGFLQSLPTAVLGTALNEKTWTEGNPLFNMLAGVGMGVGMGTFASGTIGGLTNLRGAKGVSAPAPGDIPAIRGRLVDLVPGTAEHAHLEAKYFEVNPGRTRADFQRDLDGLVMLQAKHNPEVRARLESRLRDNVTDLLPPGQKSLVADNPIEMWDAKRFEEFTGSRTGQAVVIVKDGRPTVIVKQGADPHEIAQEGFHLLQAVDPRTRARVARLDESVMSRWSSLDVREKLALYKEKLDLELDAQRSMVGALEERVAAGRHLDDPELVERLARARETLGNLQRRSRDLARIGPLERQLMAWGVLQPAPWLDQPARLFAKQPPPKPGKKPGKKAAKKAGSTPPAAPPPPAPAPATPPPPPRPIEAVKREARNSLEFSHRIEQAWEKGVTLEAGESLPLHNKEHPLLTEQLDRMRQGRQAYREALERLGDPPNAAAFDDATRAFQKVVSDTNEVMRSFGERFAVTSAPPVHVADAATARSRAGALHHSNTPEKVLDALTTSRVGASAAGELGEPLARSLPGVGLEGKAALSARGLGRLSNTSPSWLGRKLARMFRGYQRAHLVGPGFGGEAVAGLMLAPHGVNQLVQNKGIEKVLRDAAALGGEVHVKAVATGRELTIPLTRGRYDTIQVLDKVVYHVLDGAGDPKLVRNANGVLVPLTYTIEVVPGRGWQVTHTLPPGLIDPSLPMSGTY